MEDRIVNQAFTELMISCEFSGCTRDFEESLKVVARDPVWDWSVNMAAKARMAGWTCDQQGKVRCPIHSQNE